MELDTIPGADQPLDRLVFTAFDLETTGLSASHHRIVEIGAVGFSLQGVAEPQIWQQLIQPEEPIPEDIQAIHGITNEMVAQAPLFSEIVSDFLSFIGTSILLAHNASFDLTFLACELQRLEQPWPQNMGLDTCRLARILLPEAPNYKLSTLVEYLKLAPEGPAHRALPDAQACLGVFKACVQALPQDSPTLKDLLIACPQAHTGFHFQTEAEAIPWLKAIFSAMKAKKSVEILYHNGRNKKDRRTITPLFLGGSGDYAYLEAYCHLRKAHRQFRLTRILEFNG